MDDTEGQVCRVCRGEATFDEPLFYPCKCTGSIKYVHQSCLIEWLAHSNKSKCELCRHEFVFSPVYDPNMPRNIPLLVVAKRLLIHSGKAVLGVVRLCLVGFVWFILLPYMIVWTLRFFFWSGQSFAYMGTGELHRIPNFFNYTDSLRRQQSFLTHALNNTMLPSLLLESLVETNHVALPSLHQFILDCLEGEVITSVVVLVFMITFILREAMAMHAPLPALEVEPELEPDMEGLMAARNAEGPHAPRFPVDEGQEDPPQDPLVELQERIQAIRQQQDEFRRRQQLLREQLPPRPVDEPLAESSPRQSSPDNHNGTSSGGQLDSLTSGDFPQDHQSRSLQGKQPVTASMGGDINQSVTHDRPLRLDDNVYTVGFGGDPAASSSVPVLPPPLAAAPGEGSHGPKGKAPDVSAPFIPDQSTSSPLRPGEAPDMDTRKPTEGDSHYLENSITTSDSESSGTSTDSSETADENDDAEEAGIAGDGEQPEEVPENFANNAGVGEPPDDLLDAEGIDGILEALGIRGPLINLFQYFVLIYSLIALALTGTVWFPYTLGKLVLVLNPLRILLLPFMVLQKLIDFIVDSSMDYVLPWFGWHIDGALKKASSSLSVVLAEYWPGLVAWLPLPALSDNQSVKSEVPVQAVELGKHYGTMLFSWLQNWLPTTFVSQSLLSNSTGTGSPPTQAWQGLSFTGLFDMGSTPANATVLTQENLALTHYTTWVTEMLNEFWSQVAHGNTFTDRAVATALGMGIVILAAVYIMYGGYEFSGARSQSVKRVIQECASMVKITVFTSVDLLLFPVVCGWLLDIATLPLFPEPASIWTRVEYARHAHLSSAFLHWFAGTCFMFAFSIFITACRDLLRPGVLWFIRDPSDPQFHPVKDILEKPVRLQIRKIFLSLVMHACLVLGGTGLVILFVSYLPPINGTAILPLRWQITQPLSPLPVDLLLLHLLVPPTLQKLRLKRLSKGLLKRWWKMASRQLRLTSFMFGANAATEEGTFVRLTWSAWLTRKQFPLPTWFTERDETEQVILDSQRLENIVAQTLNNPSGVVSGTTQEVPQRITDDRVPDVYFQRDGSCLRVPKFDNVPLVPGRRMLVRVHPDGIPMDPTEDYPEQRLVGVVDSHRDDGVNFTVVYAPPHIRFRLLAFVLYMWLSISTVLALWCIVPLLVGRATFQFLFHALASARNQGPSGQLYAILDRFTGSPTITSLLFSWITVDRDTSVHDFYALFVGWYICGVAIWLTYYICTRGHQAYLRYWARRMEAAEGHEGNVGRLRRRQLTQLYGSAIRWLRRKGLLLSKGCILLVVMGLVLPTYIGLVGELYLGAPTRMASVYSVEQWLRSHGELRGLQSLMADGRGSMLSDTRKTTKDSGVTKSSTTSSPFNVTIPPTLLGVTLNPAWVKATFGLEKPAHGPPNGWTLEMTKLHPAVKSREIRERDTDDNVLGTGGLDPYPSIFTTPYNPSLYLLQSWAAGLIVLIILFSVLQAFPESRLTERWRRVMPNHHIHRASIRALVSEILLPATLVTIALVVLPPLFTLGLLKWTGRIDLLLNPHLLGCVYPIALFSMSVIYGACLAFSKWRVWITAIRHEEYLIGRQLHNITDGNE